MSTSHNAAEILAHPDSMLAEALRVARQGYPVVPVPPDAKKPATAHGFLDATTDPGQITLWWTRNPQNMIGVRTGSASGLAVLDLDLEIDEVTGEVIADGSARLQEAMNRNGWSFPDTVEVRTPRGGRHLYFQHEEGFKSRAHKPEGIDTRCEGAMIIHPPSKRADGKSYAFANPPGLFPIAKAPEWLAHFFRTDCLPGIFDKKPPAESIASPASGTSTSRREDVERALVDYWNPDSFDDWTNAALALHGFPNGLEIWLSWASRSSKFNRAENLRKWEQTTPTRGITERSILHRVDRGTLGDWGREHAAREREAAQQPAQKAPADAATSKAKGPAITRASRFMRVSDLEGRPVPERHFLVPGWIPMSTVTLFGGDGGTGKSLVAQQLCAAVALGRQWLGMPTKEGNALCISAEDDQDELHIRFDAIARSEQVGLGELHRLTFRSIAGEDALLATLDNKTGTLASTELLGEIDRMMDETRPVVVLLDTLADMFPGDENQRAQARQFIGMMRGLAIKYQAAVVLLAHPSLTGLNSGTGTSGTTGWSNSVRSRLYLERVVIDGYEVNPDARRLSVKKANYARVGTEVLLTYRDHVFIADTPESGLERHIASNKAERAFLKLLQQFTEQGRYVSAQPSCSYAPKLFAEAPDNEGCSKRAFTNAMNLLFSAEKIEIRKQGPKSRERSYIAIAPERFAGSQDES